MTVALDFLCGLGWTVAYILAVVRGFRYKTWCIPGFSICMNFAWELSAVLERISNGSTLGLPFAMQLSWLVFDLGILATWLLYDRSSKRQLLKNILLFLTVLITVYSVARLAGHWEFSVFLINLLMSLEFLVRLEKDPSAWASRGIAVAKLVGTLAATLLNGLVYTNLAVLWMGGLCLLLDSYYICRLFVLKRSD